MTDTSGKVPPFVAASDRNKQPILEELGKILPESCWVLEIGSGWGQHAVHFCHALPGLTWQPSDRGERLPELIEQLKISGLQSIKPPVALDVLHDKWPRGPFGAAYSANTAHIMPWPAVVAMISGVGRCLAIGGLFCIYGPFNENGQFTSTGNEDFNLRLREIDPARGIRDMEELENVAKKHQMKLEKRVPMPANNYLLVFRKC